MYKSGVAYLIISVVGLATVGIGLLLLPYSEGGNRFGLDALVGFGILLIVVGIYYFNKARKGK